MRIALCQQNLIVGDFLGNVRRLVAAVTTAGHKGADLAVCSELALTGYPPRDLLDRPAFLDTNRRALDQFAAEAPIPAVVGFVDRTTTASGPRLYNAAALVMGGAVVSVHHKSLLPTYDVFDEARHFVPAERVHLAELGGVKLGISICEDAWNDAELWPERRYDRDPIAELVALGADILINLSASPFALAKRALRPRLMAAHARRHGRPLIIVNQVGGNDDLLFDGASLAFSADGTLAARAHEFDDDILAVDVAPRGAVTGGVIRDIPPYDGGGDATSALAGLVMGTRDYATTCGFSTAVVGLSGGVDSALTCAIAARAFGGDNVMGVAMPSRYSSDHSVRDARTLAHNLGVEYREISIESPFRAFTQVLGPVFGSRPPDVTEENLQARIRAVLLMALSNKLGHLLLTTGNKSELAVGYCTLYGDMSGGLAVLSDVPKTLVYHLSQEVNRQAGRALIPESTLTKAPSAELRPDQTDQDSLPPYEVLDAIVELHVEAQLSRDEILARGFPPETVEHVLRLLQQSEYKRRQAAPGLKLTSKAFGPGRRIPIATRWRD
jgi:NAD+ synthetase